jgi:hypothetical protein
MKRRGQKQVFFAYKEIKNNISSNVYQKEESKRLICLITIIFRPFLSGMGGENKFV